MLKCHKILLNPPIYVNYHENKMIIGFIYLPLNPQSMKINYIYLYSNLLHWYNHGGSTISYLFKKNHCFVFKKELKTNLDLVFPFCLPSFSCLILSFLHCTF